MVENLDITPIWLKMTYPRSAKKKAITNIDQIDDATKKRSDK